MAKRQEVTDSAAREGELWGARARDWAELQEPQLHRVYAEAIRRTGIGPTSSVLDVGCGSGLFCRLAADAGAHVCGIDSARKLLEIARQRTPEGDFRLGDFQYLPYRNDSFDVVTGFNAFHHAADPIAALREARRVGKPGALVFVLIWGREERTQLVVFLDALYPLLPPVPPEARSFALSYEGALEALVAKAGLRRERRDTLRRRSSTPTRTPSCGVCWQRAPGSWQSGGRARRRSGRRLSRPWRHSGDPTAATP